MTRDFNKQRRDDMRPSSREQSSSRNGDERSPRPARPRLNRETVDRAWESGAPAKHADYRTRSNNGNRGPAPRNNWRDDRQNGQFGQNRQGGQYPTRNSRPSYGERSEDRQGNPRRFDNTTNGPQGYQSNQRPPSRPFNADRSDRPNRPYGNSRPGSNPPGSGTRPEYRERSRPYEPRPPHRDNAAGGGFQRRDREGYGGYERTDRRDGPERYERGPRQFERNNRSDAGNYNGRPPRSFDRDRRAPGNNYRDTRSPRDAETRDSQNPRWQSRPAAQRDSGYRQEQNGFQSQTGQPGRERYEGDYERFNGTEDRPRFAGQPSHKYDNSKPRGRYEGKKPRKEVQERHVTPLPDGRVLKGPRPVQRKNAEFWTGIAQNTDALLDSVKEVPTPQQEAANESNVEQVLPTDDNSTVQLLPTDDSPTVQVLPTDDNSTVQLLPTDDNSTVQLLPTDDNSTVQLLPTDDNSTVQLLPTDDNSTVQLLPTDDSIVTQEMPANDSPDVQEQTVAEEGTKPIKAKPRNRATTPAARSKKASAKQAKTSGPVPRPSRRGFKWPTPE